MIVFALAAAASLDGRWISSCVAMGKSGRHGTIVELSIAGTGVTATAETYAHADCDVPTIETRLAATAATLTVGGDGRLAATLTVDAISMTPERAEVVAIWNRDRAGKGCAGRDWRLGETQSVAGNPCAPGIPFPKRGAPLSVKGRFDGDTLRIPVPLPGGGRATIALTRAPQ